MSAEIAIVFLIIVFTVSIAGVSVCLSLIALVFEVLQEV